MSERSAYRVQLWDYYDRRAQLRAREVLAHQEEDWTPRYALEYWHGLGIDASAQELEAENRQVCEVLHSLEPATYLEIGSGPGTYTSVLPGRGIALDQSAAALQSLSSQVQEVPTIQADALQLPLRHQSVERIFATHIYGILHPDDRNTLLNEARRVLNAVRRVTSQIVVVDSGRPAGVPAEHWQQRSSGLDDKMYRVLRRHFDAPELADEIGAHVLLAGRFYVVVAVDT
jgi:SAM-dependent methyltransferase